jgi:restriction system protein
MFKNSTIKDAILKVFDDEEKPLSVNYIYDKIIELNYYRFRSTNPRHIVLTTIRRQCEGLDFSSSRKKKIFQLLPDGRYWILGKPINGKKIEVEKNKGLLSVNELKDSHSSYIKEFKKSLLKELKEIDPTEFELFCKLLLKAYGFKNLTVTRPKTDGGIDGYGKLKLGIAYLNVAFECKRWKNTSIGRPEISRFRGDIQGEYEQGIFITTSTFSKDAIQAATKKGAVPIALIDGKMIVDIMLEKKFGVDVENLPLYINTLPEIFA